MHQRHHITCVVHFYRQEAVRDFEKIDGTFAATAVLLYKYSAADVLTLFDDRVRILYEEYRYAVSELHLLSRGTGLIYNLYIANGDILSVSSLKCCGMYASTASCPARPLMCECSCETLKFEFGRAVRVWNSFEGVICLNDLLRTYTKHMIEQIHVNARTAAAGSL